MKHNKGWSNRNATGNTPTHESWRHAQSCKGIKTGRNVKRYTTPFHKALIWKNIRVGWNEYGGSLVRGDPKHPTDILRHEKFDYKVDPRTLELIPKALWRGKNRQKYLHKNYAQLKKMGLEISPYGDADSDRYLNARDCEPLNPDKHGLSNSKVAEEFAKGKQKGASGTMFIEGDVIYSYGYHFPIARKIAGKNIVLFNEAGYSSTTTRHKSHVLRALENAGYRIVTRRNIMDTAEDKYYE